MNKEQKMWITVTISTIVVLILLFAGITYAFFTTNDNVGSTAEIINTSGKMTITYADGGSNLLVSSNISPSNNIIANKTFTLTGLNTTTAGDGLAMEYKVGLNYDNEFSDGMIHYYIKKVSSSSDSVTTVYNGTTDQTIPGNESETGYSHGTLSNGQKYTEMVTGEFPANKDEQTITFNLKLQFPDNGENQDSEKGKTLNAEIFINNERVNFVQKINDLYATNSKDENGITLDGLQKDGTGDFNVTLVSNVNKDYKVTLLNDFKLIADTEYDEYDNLRYVGATPNNYISFNNEVWRIIGVFNVYNNETKKYEKLVKIVRNESLGKYSWDTSESNINSGNGINEWSQADLMTELNTDYLDTSKTSGTTKWYNESNNAKNGSYDYSKNIKSGYIDKIANVRWNLGAAWGDNMSVSNTYKEERGTVHISNPSDGIIRKNTWDGKVSLIYASDFAYASIDSSCRNNIASYFMESAINPFVGYCKNKNWLFNNLSYWTVTTSKNREYTVLMASSSGQVNANAAAINNDVRPALFLKSDVLITGGTGKESDPYTID